MDVGGPKLSLMGMPPEELAGVLAPLGQPSYRARQLFYWLQRGVSFDEMTDLPQELRAQLHDLAQTSSLEEAAEERAPDGAVKFAFRTADGHVVESVLIPHSRRTTVCVSSQIGCAFGCRFCATGKRGLVRDLAAGEIVEQVVRVQARCQPDRVSNVVFMGMGEPLANYGSVVRAVRVLNQPGGLHIGARRIAISTCGLPEQMRQLAAEGLQVALAVSLHAATDAIRNELVPINRTHPIAEVVAAASDFARRTGRKVAFQYVVVPGLNDTRGQARRLVEIARGLPYMVNVIPRNPTSGFEEPDDGAAARFARRLRRLGVEVAVRRSRGAEVLGACGQLRGRLAGQQSAGRA
jgi:23S rRNA (adenine2503-C2)-methyltransferase